MGLVTEMRHLHTTSTSPLGLTRSSVPSSAYKSDPALAHALTPWTLPPLLLPPAPPSSPGTIAPLTIARSLALSTAAGRFPPYKQDSQVDVLLVESFFLSLRLLCQLGSCPQPLEQFEYIRFRANSGACWAIMHPASLDLHTGVSRSRLVAISIN